MALLPGGQLRKVAMLLPEVTNKSKAEDYRWQMSYSYLPYRSRQGLRPQTKGNILKSTLTNLKGVTDISDKRYFPILDPHQLNT